jgi:hypothetical protein
MRAAWRFARPAAGTPTAGSGSQMHRLEVPSPPVWLPAPTPPWPPAPWTRVKGLQAMPPPQVAPGGRRRRGDAGCVALTGRSFRSPPEAPEDCRTPRPTARRGASVLRSRHHHHHLGVITPGAPAAATAATATAAAAATAAGSAIASLPGSLDGPGPQVSVVPFSLSLIIMSTSLNPSSVC